MSTNSMVTVDDPLQLSHGSTSFLVCNPCLASIRSHRTPRLSYANDLYTGAVPLELQELTVIEESMIARCRAKTMIVQLKYDGDDGSPSPILQKGLKGNVLIFPQHPEVLPPMLPPTIEDVLSYVCIIFVGSQPPTREWLDSKAKPLAVRADKIRAALLWLKANNPLYKDVMIDLETLSSLPKDGTLLPFHVEHVKPSEQRDATTSSYDPWSQSQNIETPLEPGDPSKIPFQSVLISNIDHNISSRQLRAAAVKHVKDKAGTFFAVPHDPVFVNTFTNADLFPLLYPTLFPFACGAPGGLKGQYPVSFEAHVRHLLSLHDQRFQKHHSFQFTCFNLIQRKSMLLSISLRTRKARFADIAKSFAKATSLAAHEVLDKLNTSDSTHFPIVADTEAQEEVLKLNNEVRMITRTVLGSSGARLEMRNEIRALMMSLGIPSLYVTINPADVFNPVVQILNGAEVDIDSMTSPFPYMDQATLVASNPVIAAKFFHTYINAFVSELLAYNPEARTDPRKKRLGVLGYTEAFYGCIEAQGRGSLHCHMVIWIEGALNPNELKKKLLDETQGPFRDKMAAYLDDIIANEIPSTSSGDHVLEVLSDHHHACAVRGYDPLDESELNVARRVKDLKNLVLKCQVHRHGPTCYKYWRGPPEPRECRFNLDASHTVKDTTIDMETGEIELRHVNGIVNNYNPTILEAVRNNMDIKFIGSGQSAKAIVFYITDYISKSQLKAHVAFTALERAIYKLETSTEDLSDSSLRAKRLLQKCAYELLGRQELSAQQVSSYLLGYKDDVKSHSFRPLFWVSAEGYLNALLPSPECYRKEEEGTPIAPTDDSAEEDTEEEPLEDDEVEDHFANDLTVIDADPETGSVIPRASQLRDYVYRGDTFASISLWDFAAQIEKRKFGSKDSESISEVCSNSVDGVALMESVWRAYNGCLLEVKTKSRPSCRLMDEHDESQRSYLTIIPPSARRVPVLIGPMFPRRDRPDVYPKYCRLALMLFKPWRTAKDLKGEHRSWDEAFEAFKLSTSYTADVAGILNNIQLLHECKDSKDDDFRRRRDRMKRGIPKHDRGPQIAGIDDDALDVLGDDVREPVDEMNAFQFAEFLDSIDRKLSRRITAKILACKNALKIAANCGMIQSEDMIDRGHSLAHVLPSSPDDHKDVGVEGDNMETVWKAEYQRRRKERNSIFNAENSVEPLVAERVPDNNYDPQRIPVIVNTNSDVPSEWDAFSQTVSELSLNNDQKLALKIVVSHVASRSNQPLRMVIHGAAGTGKSRVIDSIKTFFEHRRQLHRLRVASFMGIAAKNVGGETLHSLLNLQGLSKLKRNSDTHMDMIAKWESADWLIVDEVSMLSLGLLYQVNEGLQWAKESERPFGNINLIFVGDFAQLPPVCQTRLYARINAKSLCGTENGQRNIFAKLLWLSFDTVVNLKIAQRQTGTENARFLELLSRLREGRCTDDDYKLLNSRVLGPQHEEIFSPTDSPWKFCPLIVYENAPKDALNEAKSIQFAIDRNLPLHWYYARDYLNGKEITDEDLKARLMKQDSGKTMSRLGRIPLCIGMPVLVSQNFDVQGGVVNGSYGTVKSIRYRTIGAGFRVLTSCVVNLQDSDCEPMTGLEVQDIPILCDSVRIEFRDSYKKMSRTVERRQVAIVPAFAMTAHRSQGQTLTRVVVDLQSCHGSEAPYVMVSRATSLQGLYVFRPFEKKKITCSQSEDLRMEMKRLDLLDKVARAKWNGEPPPPTEDSQVFASTKIKEDDLHARHAMSDRSTRLLQAVQNEIDVMLQKNDVPPRVSRKRKRRVDMDDL